MPFDLVFGDDLRQRDGLSLTPAVSRQTGLRLLRPLRIQGAVSFIQRVQNLVDQSHALLRRQLQSLIAKLLGCLHDGLQAAMVGVMACECGGFRYGLALQGNGQNLV